ncbi:MAG: hypothetical protein LQ337_003477 [Flavoplaca oasis]|nr:MAG: hypothetical protein LQ337_003477 [Flavoplaca oasis]
MSSPVSLIDLALGLRDHILEGTFDRELVNSYLRPYAEIVQLIDPSLLADDTTFQVPESSYHPHALSSEEPSYSISDLQAPVQKRIRLSEETPKYQSPESFVFDYTPPVISSTRLSATKNRKRKVHSMETKRAPRGSLTRIPATTEVPLRPLRVFHTSYEGSNQPPSPCVTSGSTEGGGLPENAILAEDKALREESPLPTAAQPVPVQDDLGNSRSMYDHILFYDQIEYKK